MINELKDILEDLNTAMVICEESDTLAMVTKSAERLKRLIEFYDDDGK